MRRSSIRICRTITSLTHKGPEQAFVTARRTGCGRATSLCRHSLLRGGHCLTHHDRTSSRATCTDRNRRRRIAALFRGCRAIAGFPDKWPQPTPCAGCDVCSCHPRRCVHLRNRRCHRCARGYWNRGCRASGLFRRGRAVARFPDEWPECAPAAGNGRGGPAVATACMTGAGAEAAITAGSLAATAAAGALPPPFSAAVPQSPDSRMNGQKMPFVQPAATGPPAATTGCVTGAGAEAGITAGSLAALRGRYFATAIFCGRPAVARFPDEWPENAFRAAGRYRCARGHNGLRDWRR